MRESTMSPGANVPVGAPSRDRTNLTRVALVICVGVGIWIAVAKLMPSPLIRTAAAASDAFAARDGGRIYDAMASEERAALGISRTGFQAAWDNVIGPDFSTMVLDRAEPAYTNGNLPREAVASVVFHYPDGTSAGLSSVVYPTERGVSTEISRSVVIQWAMNICRKKTGDTEKTHQTLVSLLKLHRLELERYGLKGFYSLKLRRLITWDEILARKTSA